MNAKNPLPYFLIVPMAAMSAGAGAHHSVSAHFDPRGNVELRGVVVDYRLQSPHTTLSLEVRDEDGTAQLWEVQGASLPQMRREGFDADTFQEGDVVMAFGFPSRVPDRPLIFGTRFITANGMELGAMPTPDDEPSPENSAAGVERVVGRWIAPFGGGSAGPRSPGSPLPLTPEAVAIWEDFEEARSPLIDCGIEVPAGQSPTLFYPVAYIHDIRIDEREVTLYHEPFDLTRRVPLGAEARLAEPSGASGMASASIEGDTLVIESSGYPPSEMGLAYASSPIGNGGDIPSSAEKTVTERYSVGEDGKTLRIEYTVMDPVYLTEPFTAHVEFKRVADDTPIYESAWQCGG